MSGRFDERVRGLVEEATTCADGGDWDAVQALCSAALALVPDDAAALALLDRAVAATAPAGERRQLTVMFCDVVGSTALSNEHDPELVREVLRSYQAACDQAVRRYDGRIARYIGDGVLAYFGHPIAHEDDARRAVKAGLDLLTALRPITEEIRASYDVELAVRVAVHTGVVVLGDMGSTTTPDRDAIVGDTPNLASRLQDHAAPGSLVISQQTYELVRGWFLVAPLGSLELRGFPEPVAAYTVVDETAIESRVQAQADLSPFVGRAAELAVVTAAWEQARSGAHGAVLVSGQAGVGKSRLADVLRRRVPSDDGAALVANCSTYHGTTTLFPVRRLLERAAEIDNRQAGEHALPRLWNVLDAVGQAASAPLLADLLELPPTSWCPAPELEPALLHEQLLVAIVDFVRATAARRPLLLHVDDLQWADPSTIELIGRLLRARIPGLLLVLTARDEFRCPWPSVEHLELDRMTVAELDELAQRLPDGRRLDRPALDDAIERSDGIPFFLEELLRSSVLSQAGDAGRGTAIPAALRDMLLARFAAPGVDLQVAQLLATVGGEATAPVAAAICGLRLDEVEGRLQPLVDADILVRTPGEPSSYGFRHHLLADLAYDTQLRPARQRAHGAVAEALRSSASVGVAAAPAVIAHHLAQAGRDADAVMALHEAAIQAHGLGANEEVGALVARGLELTDAMPAAEGRDLALHLHLIRAANVASQLGYAAPQAVADYEAAKAITEVHEFSAHLDDLPPEEVERSELWTASVTGLWAALLLQGQLDDCDEINRRLCAKFRPGGVSQRYAEVVGQSMTTFFRGDWHRAVPIFEEHVARSREFTLPGSTTVPSDPAASATSHLGYALVMAGRCSDATTAFHEALDGAEGHGFPMTPFSQCYVLGVWASAEAIIGSTDRAAELAARQQALAARHGFSFWSLISSLHTATGAFVAGDDAAGGQALMTIAMLRATGVLSWAPTFLGVVAAGQLDRGDTVAARATVADALDLASSTGCHLWTPELHRIAGAARLVDGDPGGEDELRAGIELAVEAGAVLHELWGRTSLHRHVPGDATGSELAALLDRVDLPAGAPARTDAEALLA